MRRLLSGLTQNVAETGDGSPFPELRAGLLEGTPEEVYRSVGHTIRRLGWHIVQEDPVRLEIQAVAATAVFGFKDDVTVRIRSTPDGTPQLWLRSASRVGRGDLGANRRRIAAFLRQFAPLDQNCSRARTGK